MGIWLFDLVEMRWLGWLPDHINGVLVERHLSCSRGTV
jgi:hypothetical protein